ncbi:MAG TPA: hypothetical protein VF702_01250 [Allosphingosinicella sp.]
MDIVDYSAASAAIHVTLSAAAPPTFVVDDGDGTPETVDWAEILIGSAYGDTLVLAALAAATAAAIGHIDLGGGVDTVDLSAIAEAVTADLAGLAAQTVAPASGGVLHLMDAERFVFAAGADIVLAGAGIFFIDGGDGGDTLTLASTAGSRIDGDASIVLLRTANAFEFENFETIVGGAQSDFVYGGTLQAHYVGGAGANYLEGAGAGTILESTSGDSWIVARDGATIVSGAGDDFLEALGAAPVTIVFGRGSGHDMLNLHFNGPIVWPADPGGLPYVDQRSDSFPERLADTILLSGLSLADIELVWDWQAYQAPLEVLGVGDAWDFKLGPAAIRILDTGETLHLGTIAAAWIGGDFCLVLMGDSEWDISLVFHDGANSAYGAFGVEYDLFELAGGQRYSLLDLFALETLPSAPLPAAATAAQGLLARLGSEGGAIVGTSDHDSIEGTSGSDDIFGGNGSDRIEDGEGDDFVRAGDNWDAIEGGPGDDDYDGGPGEDHVDYGGSIAPVVVDLAAGTAYGADIGADRLISIESVSGGAGDDILRGTAGRDHLVAGGGDDLLEGRGGDDSYAYNATWNENGFVPGGDDVIHDTGGFDILYLPLGLGADQIAVSLAPNDSYLLSFAGGGSVTLVGAVDPAHAIEEIMLGDGSWWTPEMLAALADPALETFTAAGTGPLSAADFLF